MLIPSIDLMGGKIVQLVQGRRKALEFSNFKEWIARLTPFPLVQLIDLDAAMGQGENSALVAEISNQIPCQVGGGIRDTARAKTLLENGARRVILGSVLIHNGQPQLETARRFADTLGPDALTFAIDSKGGKVSVDGWKTSTPITPLETIESLQSFCNTFLYTNIDTEGLMQGIPLEIVRTLRRATTNQFIAAGGITTREEIEALHADGIDAVVGMAIYTGKLRLEDFIPQPQTVSAPTTPRAR